MRWWGTADFCCFTEIGGKHNIRALPLLEGCLFSEAPSAMCLTLDC